MKANEDKLKEMLKANSSLSYSQMKDEKKFKNNQKKEWPMIKVIQNDLLIYSLIDFTV
jgi:hypothetical protein